MRARPTSPSGPEFTPVIDVLEVLRIAKSHVLRNASILDQISAPLAHSNPARKGGDVKNATSPGSSSTSTATMPISKHILTSIFDALDGLSEHNQPNYVHIENNFQNHFWCGLVLPLIARLLAVSSPGLLCLIQVPSSSGVPSWVNSADKSKSCQSHPHSQSTSGITRDERAKSSGKHGTPNVNPRKADYDHCTNSNVSGMDVAEDSKDAEDPTQKISKSENCNKDMGKFQSSPQTVPSSTRKTTSSSPLVLKDNTGSPKKRARSRDVADGSSGVNSMPNFLSAMEKGLNSIDKGSNTATPTGLPNRNEMKENNAGDRNSNHAYHNHRALRLICNGFEVLTGKMPPPQNPIGPFTLATVAWEMAGVITPDDPARAVSMSFSNGMMTPTEGIVVTFSNGSMCALTLADPFSLLQELKTTKNTPVVVFSFAPKNYPSLGEILKAKPSSLGETAVVVRDCCNKRNVLLVEIGQGFLSGESHSGGSGKGDNSQPRSEKQSAEPDHSGAGRAASLDRSCPRQSTQSPNTASCAISVNVIPRAVPLFVNTINQIFIDGPFHDVSPDLQGRLESNFAVGRQLYGMPHGSSYLQEQYTTPINSSNDQYAVPQALESRRESSSSRSFDEGRSWGDGRDNGTRLSHGKGGHPSRVGSPGVNQACTNQDTGNNKSSERNNTPTLTGGPRRTFPQTMTFGHSAIYGYYPYPQVYAANSPHASPPTVVGGPDTTMGAQVVYMHHGSSHNSPPLQMGRQAGCYIGDQQAPSHPSYLSQNVPHQPYVHGSFYHPVHAHGPNPGSYMVHQQLQPPLPPQPPPPHQQRQQHQHHHHHTYHPFHIPQQHHSMNDSRGIWNANAADNIPHHNSTYHMGMGPGVSQSGNQTISHGTVAPIPASQHSLSMCQAVPPSVPVWTNNGLNNEEHGKSNHWVGCKDNSESKFHGWDKVRKEVQATEEINQRSGGNFAPDQAGEIRKQMDSGDNEGALAALLGMREQGHSRKKGFAKDAVRIGEKEKYRNETELQKLYDDGKGCGGISTNGHCKTKRRNEYHGDGSESESEDDESNEDENGASERVNGHMPGKTSQRGYTHDSSTNSTSQLEPLANRTLGNADADGFDGHRAGSSVHKAHHQRKRVRQR